MSEGRLTLTVVTPERAVVSGIACDAVSLPGFLGELGVLPGHAPLVALLGVGKLTWQDGAGAGAIAVRGGFVEVARDAVRVLADQAAMADGIETQRVRLVLSGGEAKRLAVSGEADLANVNSELAYAEACLSVKGGDA